MFSKSSVFSNNEYQNLVGYFNRYPIYEVEYREIINLHEESEELLEGVLLFCFFYFVFAVLLLATNILTVLTIFSAMKSAIDLSLNTNSIFLYIDLDSLVDKVILTYCLISISISLFMNDPSCILFFIRYSLIQSTMNSCISSFTSLRLYETDRLRVCSSNSIIRNLRFKYPLIRLCNTSPTTIIPTTIISSIFIDNTPILYTISKL